MRSCEINVILLLVIKRKSCAIENLVLKGFLAAFRQRDEWSGTQSQFLDAQVRWL